jgi:hypothetical protein
LLLLVVVVVGMVAGEVLVGEVLVALEQEQD